MSNIVSNIAPKEADNLLSKAQINYQTSKTLEKPTVLGDFFAFFFMDLLY